MLIAISNGLFQNLQLYAILCLVINNLRRS